MAGIYYFVFVKIFQRGGHDPSPYIVFLLAGLLPWTWFSNAVTDCTKAFTREAKLIRSTNLPRSVWIVRMILSKAIEFVASIPVLIAFALITGATLHWQAIFWLLAIVLQAVLLLGVGLAVAPLVTLFRDLERAIRLILRILFYATPIVYGHSTLIESGFSTVASFNPLTGIMGLYRGAFFPSEIDWLSVSMSAAICVVVLVLGCIIFRGTIRTVLKEL